MSSKPTLKLDWCSHEAAKYAVEHWHYARKLPRGKTVKIGVWENERFIGSVVFARGNGVMGNFLGLDQFAVAELSRVALTNHRAPVSRIVAISVKMLIKEFPGLRLLVSYADPLQGHNGGIYQAMNWFNVGTSAPDTKYIDKTGREWHSRNISSNGFKVQFGRRTYTPPKDECIAVALPPKHKYLYALDDEIKQKIAPLAKPYPKRPRAGSIDSDAAAFHVEEGGATPTSALQEADSQAVIA